MRELILSDRLENLHRLDCSLTQQEMTDWNQAKNEIELGPEPTWLKLEKIIDLTLTHFTKKYSPIRLVPPL